MRALRVIVIAAMGLVACSAPTAPHRARCSPWDTVHVTADTATTRPPTARIRVCTY